MKQCNWSQASKCVVKMGPLSHRSGKSCRRKPPHGVVCVVFAWRSSPLTISLLHRRASDCGAKAVHSAKPQQSCGQSLLFIMCANSLTGCGYVIRLLSCALSARIVFAKIPRQPHAREALGGWLSEAGSPWPALRSQVSVAICLRPSLHGHLSVATEGQNRITSTMFRLFVHFACACVCHLLLAAVCQKAYFSPYPKRGPYWLHQLGDIKPNDKPERPHGTTQATATLLHRQNTTKMNCFLEFSIEARASTGL